MEFHRTQGVYGAISDDQQWCYVVAQTGNRAWTMIETAVPEARAVTTEGFATRGDAYAEAAEREEMHMLLGGRYRMTRLEVAEALQMARRERTPVTIGVLDGQSVELGRDAGGYTVAVRDRPRVAPHGHYRRPGDHTRTPRCPHCLQVLAFAWCRRCGWDNGIDVPPPFPATVKPVAAGG